VDEGSDTGTQKKGQHDGGIGGDSVTIVNLEVSVRADGGNGTLSKVENTRASIYEDQPDARQRVDAAQSQTEKSELLDQVRSPLALRCLAVDPL
jgi:hypothetical protein